MDKSQAQGYSKTSLMQKEHGLKLLKQLCPHKGMKVLDLGCGTGYLSKVWAEHIGPEGKVVAVDPDGERLQLAAETYGMDSNIFFQKGSTDEIPEDQYDIVYTNYVMHWVKDKELAFMNVYKNLKPGGSFGIQVALQMGKLIDQMTELMGAETAQQINHKFLFVPCETYEQIALHCGFSLQFKYKTTSIVKFQNVKEMLDWWYGTTHGVFNAIMIDPATLEEFKRSFEDKALEVDIGVVATLIFLKPVIVSV